MRSLVIFGLVASILMLMSFVTFALEGDEQKLLLDTVQKFFLMFFLPDARWKDFPSDDAIAVNREWQVQTDFLAWFGQWLGQVHIKLFDTIEVYIYKTRSNVYAIIRSGADTAIAWKDEEHVFILEQDETNKFYHSWKLKSWILQPLNEFREKEIPNFNEKKEELLGIIDRKGEIKKVELKGNRIITWGKLKRLYPQN